MSLLDRRVVRRMVTVPVVFVAFFLVVTTLPLWLLAAAFASPWIPGRMRPLRLLCFAVIYLALQVVGLVVLGVLWVASGFGYALGRERFRRYHYRLLATLLAVLMRAARRLFHLNLAIEIEPTPDVRPEVPHDDPRPLLVLSRHAGPGDSFLLVHELISEYGRRPRIVLKDALQWDPLIDVLLSRIPTRFISPGRAGAAETIGTLASDLGPNDALVIFPEGANFTPRRRAREIERLEQEGRQAEAERARRLRHMLVPRPAGTLAAMSAAPQADVVFVAHCGLEGLSTLRDLWRGVPMDADVRGRLWTVPCEDVPPDDGERTEWLYTWWPQLDDWIDANAP